ncbi:glycine hydroxymethyltransferase [Ancylobacter dichloromethanicus]|uniref:Serine hydroxymethyltransferase n=1 Tax=Ancylobacter dichloromethanicus TaxID=518825 RepID=A0A9W6JD95_9HYPH|nr:glycine hydroxymethyltransferase [Ancylobacter dichloromethanicus]MBS7556629.1 glycine hydroxymethyltransferase [Ancylobacter dichloromethanicus]GLK73478.1 serine hydroxymethyltransferase [Ancylobacter dichloromethanicus]
MNPDHASLFAAARDHADTLARHRLVLYAGANLPSPEVSAATAPGLGAMPAMGPSFDKEQPGTEMVSRFEVAVREEACALFGAAWAEPRLPSATLCNLAVFHAFARPGDLMLAPGAAHGGHLSQRRGGTPELAGLACAELPFDATGLCLDTAGAARMVEQRRPRLVMLGRSVMVRPDDIAEVVAAARAVGATTVFDASHVAGLIAGGTYPNPLSQGVDVLVTSTYKTLPGMPHGLVLGRDPAQGEALARLLDARFLANYNAALLPPLLRLLVAMRTGAAAYAARIVANTAALASACRQRGLPVIAPEAGHTHQFLIPIDPDVEPRALIATLAASGVIVGLCPDITRPGRTALRVGTQFLATLGLGALAMEEVAGLLAALLTGPEGVSPRTVAGDVPARIAALLAR